MKQIPLKYIISKNPYTNQEFIDFILTVKFTNGTTCEINFTEFDENLQNYYIRLIRNNYKPYITLKETNSSSSIIRQTELVFEKDNDRRRYLITLNQKYDEHTMLNNWSYILKVFNINPAEDNSYLFMLNKIKQGKHFNEI